jgi:glutaredoxin
MKKLLQSILIASLLVCWVEGCKKPSGDAKETSTTDVALKDNAVKLEFYVMSQCPFGVKVEDAITPVLEKIGDYVDFHLDFIVTPQADGTFKSLHGQPEVDGNIVQLCARKLYPKKYLKFVGCQNKNYRAIPGNWEGCSKELGFDEKAMAQCKDGQEGKDLLKESAAKAKARAARGSPTIFMNDAKYSGGRKTNDFMRSICQAIKGDKPKACGEIPEPVKITMTVLKDARCTDRTCQNLPRIIGQLKGVFAGAEVKIQRFLKPAGTYKHLTVGAKFDPNAEICDNKKDDTGNGKIDCADETCKEQLVCRKEIPKQLDVFVMSQCPYGVKALDAMKEVLDNFGSDMKFNVNFIATETPDGGFKALHGQPEVDENIRELCAIKHYPKNYKYMDYILCRNKNIRSADWKPCATGGIDAKVMEKCFTDGEGKKLLAKNIKIANALGVSGSPTWNRPRDNSPQFLPAQSQGKKLRQDPLRAFQERTSSRCLRRKIIHNCQGSVV